VRRKAADFFAAKRLFHWPAALAPQVVIEEARQKELQSKLELAPIAALSSIAYISVNNSLLRKYKQNVLKKTAAFIEDNSQLITTDIY